MIAAIYALLIVLLMTIPADSEAECAWVLWFQMEQGSPWQMERAFQTESACRTMRTALIESSLQMLKEKSRISAQCLPDSIDPRAPKGGGR